MSNFTQKLEILKEQGRYRRLVLPGGIDLSSNDYLGFAAHPHLITCAQEFLAQEGAMIGAAGSRLLRGHQQAHEQAEAKAAQVFSAPAALYFSSGFQANYALITTLISRQDIIIYDEYVHASMRDGIAASPAKALRAGHNDAGAFEALLKKAAQERRADGTLWILVESVYSMDGDFASLAALNELARHYDAMLIVDEAHATGVYGAQGRGLAYELARGCDYDHIITLHTCGKALGVAGALVCASTEVITYLINAARPFVYSTAPLPLQAALVEAALDLMMGEHGDAARVALQGLCDLAQQEFGGRGSQIIPLIIGEDTRAVEVATALQGRGFDIRAIRPPTVPAGTARLRLSLGAGLSQQNLLEFTQAYKEIIANAEP